MSKTVLIPIADGTEEIEAVVTIDTLRRAGADVTVAGVDRPGVTASRGVRLVADTTVAACAPRSFDLIALPGGMPGSTHLAQCEPLIDLLRQQVDAGRWVAAICAAPAVVLQGRGLLGGHRATCYPSLQAQLTDAATDPVVVDRPFITAQGPGVALAFALTCVERLFDRPTRDRVAAEMLAQC